MVPYMVYYRTIRCTHLRRCCEVNDDRITAVGYASTVQTRLAPPIAGFWSTCLHINHPYRLLIPEAYRQSQAARAPSTYPNATCKDHYPQLLVYFSILPRLPEHVSATPSIENVYNKGEPFLWVSRRRLGRLRVRHMMHAD